MTSLRRRGLLVPLDEAYTEAAPEFMTNNVFDRYVSPCAFRVSNDPLVVSEEEICDATIYGCIRDHTFLISEDENVKTIDLQYDYDLYYRFDNTIRDFPTMVEFLEGTMLEHLATLLDIKQCPPEEINADSIITKNRSGRRGLTITRRNLQEFTPEQKSVFVAINSAPTDLASYAHDCLVLPGTAGTSCQSMVGKMKLYVERARVSEEDEIAIKDAVLGALEAGMRNGVYSIGVIKNLVWLGPGARPIATPTWEQVMEGIGASTGLPEATTAPDAIFVKGDQSSGEIGNSTFGLIAGASTFALFLAIMILFIAARRQQEGSSSSHNNIPKEMLMDEEDGTMEKPSRSCSPKKRRGNSQKRIEAYHRELEKASKRMEDESALDKSIRSKSPKMWLHHNHGHKKMEDEDSIEKSNTSPGEKLSRSSSPNKRPSYLSCSPMRMRGRSRQRRIAPAISLEGSEIPGSLAAMDALALKPQIVESETTENPEGGDNNQDPHFSVMDSGKQSRSQKEQPQPPPRVERRPVPITTPSRESPLDETESSEVEAGIFWSSSSRGSSVEEGQEAEQKISISSSKGSPTEEEEGEHASIGSPPPSIPSLSLAPLSPIRNQRTGESPSRVSPRRLPAPLNKPYVSTNLYSMNHDHEPVSSPRNASAVEEKRGKSGGTTALVKNLGGSGSSSAQETANTATTDRGVRVAQPNMSRH